MAPYGEESSLKWHLWWWLGTRRYFCFTLTDRVRVFRCGVCAMHCIACILCIVCSTCNTYSGERTCSTICQQGSHVHNIGWLCHVFYRTDKLCTPFACGYVEFDCTTYLETPYFIKFAGCAVNQEAAHFTYLEIMGLTGGIAKCEVLEET